MRISARIIMNYEEYMERGQCMKKKVLGSLMAAVLCGLLVTGCTGQTGASTDLAEATGESADTGSSSKGGTVTLKVWTQDEELVQAMVDSFIQEHAGEAKFEITVEASGDADSRDIILNDVHSAPDVFSFPDDQLSSLVAGGVLSKVPNADEVSRANLEGAVEAATVLDTLYAYPNTADNGYFLYYDKAYLSEADVQTLDRILEVAAENEKNFSMVFNSGWYLYTFFGNTGLEFGINEDGVTNHCNWNDTSGPIKGVDIVNALTDLVANPGFFPAAEADDVMPGVEEGTTIACISGVWNEGGIKAAWGNNYGAAKLPTYTCAGQQIQMASFTGYKLVGVNANSEHLEWAHKLADWMTNEQNQMLRFEMNNQGPANSNAAASDALYEVPAIRAIVAQSEYGVLQRVGNNYWSPCTEFGENLAAGNPSGGSPQDLIDKLVAGITASTVN